MKIVIVSKLRTKQGIDFYHQCDMLYEIHFSSISRIEQLDEQLLIVAGDTLYEITTESDILAEWCYKEIVYRKEKADSNKWQESLLIQHFNKQ